MGALLKSNFLSGLLVVLPLGVIAWIMAVVVRTLWRLHELFPWSWRPENIFSTPAYAQFFNLLFTLATGLALALAISIVGWFSRQFFGRKLLELISEIILKIPFLRSIYGALDQLLKAFAAGGGKQFSRVVYVEYPRKECWSLAFVTGPARGKGIPEGHINIYVPTTPNPTSGFHLIVSESDVRDSQMSVEEAFKTILSLGIAHSEVPKNGG